MTAPATEQVWEFACRLCDRRSLHLTDAEAGYAAKAHVCPTGKRTAGIVSRVTALVSENEYGERAYTWPDPASNRREAKNRQARIEKALGDV